MKLREAPGLVLLGWEEDSTHSLKLMGLLAQSLGQVTASS